MRYSQRATRYTNRYVSRAGLTAYEFDYNAIWNGITEPVSRNNSFSFELWLPVFSNDEAKWWGKELQLTIKNTRSGNFNWGAVGGFDFDYEQSKSTHGTQEQRIGPKFKVTATSTVLTETKQISSNLSSTTTRHQLASTMNQ